MNLLHNKKKTLLAFEYGMVLAKTAHEMNVEITPELMVRAEEIIDKEFKKRSPQQLATHMVPTILAIFETN